MSSPPRPDTPAGRALATGPQLPPAQSAGPTAPEDGPVPMPQRILTVGNSQYAADQILVKFKRTASSAAIQNTINAWGLPPWNLNTFRVRYPDPNNGQPLTVSLLEASTPGAVPGFPASSYPNGLVDNHVFDQSSQLISSGGYLNPGAGYWIDAHTECELLWPSS
ncbi:MAG TPA: hypothetical protein VFJ58_00545 [Armatimonadota bacterium]|nr:hypothetical protein [Armatimonadota bacterium]